MAQLGLYITTLLTMFITCTATPSSQVKTIQMQAYIQTQCSGTQYPKTCIQNLANYVKEIPKSPRELARLSLEASLVKAKYAIEYVTVVTKKLKATKPRSREYIAFKDCLEQINDGTSQLVLSLKVMKTINENGEAKFMSRMNDVRTWLGAAWTDATTCVDGLPSLAVGGKVKAIIREKMVNVARTSANALVFLDRFASKHRVTGAKTIHT